MKMSLKIFTFLALTVDLNNINSKMETISV